MAAVEWANGQKFYVPDDILASGDAAAAFAAAVPWGKHEAQQRLAALQAQLTNFAEPSEAELLEFARQSHHAYLARRQIEDQIALAEQELKQWP